MCSAAAWGTQSTEYLPNMTWVGALRRTVSNGRWCTSVQPQRKPVLGSVRVKSGMGVACSEASDSGTSLSSSQPSASRQSPSSAMQGGAARAILAVRRPKRGCRILCAATTCSGKPPCNSQTARCRTDNPSSRTMQHIRLAGFAVVCRRQRASQRKGAHGAQLLC